ncbi:ornithine cyclodeaminase family protein [Solirubrobacter soli]|uniref:ornithine cyclodeaminase family protein n=1 Tax=Solirubrobacter soli TaxID=363832 RepID=UPI00040E5824|nr:ornithine cyclodeaminase family protein [Solirubrobacter soli]
MNLPYFSAEDVERHLTPSVAIDALGAALERGFDPETDPARTFVGLAGGGDLIMMPSELGGHLAVKLVTVGGTPRVQGVVVVFSDDTYAPVALMDGIAMTNIRTSAVSALAARHLARADASRLLIFGRGPQAAAHEAAMRAIRPISVVDIVGREAAGAPDLVRAADIICTCTTSSVPVFDGSLVRDDAVVIAIGSHDADARETDDALASRATVVVESRQSALREGGDVICAIESGALSADSLVTLSELVRGAAVPSGPRLFKSSGMSWEDAVMAGVLAARV